MHSFIHPSTHSPDLGLPPKLTWPRPRFLLSAFFFPSILAGTFGSCYSQSSVMSGDLLKLWLMALEFLINHKVGCCLHYSWT